MKIRLTYCLFFLLLFASCHEQYLPDLYLGKRELSQIVTKKKLADGLYFYQVERGYSSSCEKFMLSSNILSNSASKQLVNDLLELGYLPQVRNPAEHGPHDEHLGEYVCIPDFDTKEAAENVSQLLKQKGISLSVVHSSEKGTPTNGPFKISILELNLRTYKGKMYTRLGNNQVEGKESTSTIANRETALAAINAGYFVWDEHLGVVGDPAGISVINGQLVSEAINGRPALIIDMNQKSVSIGHDVCTNIELSIRNNTFKIHGINRKPGLILNCGNVSDTGSMEPIHDFVCKNYNEIILFDKNFGSKSESGRGFEFTLDENLMVTSTAENRGGKIPDNGYLIQAIGNHAENLRALVRLDLKVGLKMEIMSKEGLVHLDSGLYMANGGPTLVRNGIIESSAMSLEGWETQFSFDSISDEYVDKNDGLGTAGKIQKNRNNFYHNWVIRRHPRTAIGIKEDLIYLVVVYGRQPGISAGASISEMSQLMKNLGVLEAINLDGGGSSMMIVQDYRTGQSSDSEGEREIGDAIILTK